MWLLLALLSSFFLGFYDILKKSSLKQNAFIPVLFLATSIGALIFGILVVFSGTGFISADSIFFVPKVPLNEHALYFLKAIIVGLSWFFSYMALSQLPITIVVLIRATGPVWVLFGALFIYNEKFTGLQWAGIITVLVFFYIFSLAGRREGIRFLRNKWIIAIIGATLLGAVSGLYDKYLLMNFNRMAVQAWFSIYMVIIMLPFMFILWYPKRNTSVSFKFKWTIPAIGVVLSVADFLYFYALSEPESLIGIISIIRRGSVVIAFSLGALIFREVNIKIKALALFGILAGIILILLGT
jgi:transporter family protein